MKRKSTFLKYLVIMVVIFLSRGSAWAQTILRVDDDSAAGSPDGSTWGLAFKRLQDALATVSSPGPQNPYEIWVAAGTYYPDRTAAAPSGSGSQLTTFTLRNNVEILGANSANGAAVIGWRGASVMPFTMISSQG